MKALINPLENKIPFNETRDNLCKDNQNKTHITHQFLSFMNKYSFDKQGWNKQPKLEIE